MLYSVVRLRGVRIAVVMVERSQLADQHADRLIERLQVELGHEVMLVAQDQSAFKGLRAYADFDTGPYLFALLAGENIEWSELSAAA